MRSMSALKRIQRMHAKNPHCHFCSRMTRIIPRVPHGVAHPADMATVDHLVTRYDVGYGETRPYVLACRRCNNQRAIHDPTDPPLKERHRISRHVRNILARLMLVSGQVLDIQGMVARVEEAYDTGASVRT